jgi:hypothetical protein
MYNFRTPPLLTAALLFSLSAGFAEANTPLLTIDIESYDALVEDVNTIAASMDQDSAMMQAQLQGMLGAELFGLIDNAKPWHAALWMESMEKLPFVVISLPIADFAAFEKAMQTSMLGLLGAQYIDAGDTVILFGGQPGMSADSSWADVAKSYASTLPAAAETTLQLKLQMNDSIRAMIETATAAPKAQMMAAFDDPAIQASGISAESLQSMMSAYFSFYEAIIRDIDSLEYGVAVNDSNLVFSMDLRPIVGSVSAEFLEAQDIDLTAITKLTDWDADMAFLMGMGPLPESMQASMLDLMKGMMPLYGLEETVASEWMDAMNQSLPLRSEFSMNFADGIAYHASYEILEHPAAEVYDKWLKICEEIVPAEVNESSLYSNVRVERNYRKEAGHSVDLMELTLNPEHPSLQLPEQEALMENIFEGGTISYEMCLVENRIYVASKGALEKALKSTATTAPFEINANTRLAGSINLVSMIKDFWGLAAGESMPAELADADTTGMQLSFMLDVDDGVETKTVFPLKLFNFFSSFK